MRRWALLCICLCARATLPQAAPQQAVTVAQWQSGAVDLSASDQWREHDGDNATWAQPSFDDSTWQTIELDQLGAAKPGSRWYRLHVKLAPDNPRVNLLIAGGEGTYELFLNGQREAGTGLKDFFGVTRPKERVVSLPDGENDLTIAFRTRPIPIYVGWNLPLFLDVAMGTPDAIENQRQAMESERFYAALPSIAINFALMIAGLAAFALYFNQRRQSEYLWLGLYMFLLGTSNVLLYCSAAGVLSLAWNITIGDPLIYVFTIAQIEFTFCFAGRRMGRVWRVYEGLLLTPLILGAMFVAGHFPSSAYILIEAIAILPAALLLPVALFVWYRRGNREAGWLILPSLLPAATTASYDLGSVSLFTGWGKADFLSQPIQFGPIPLQLSDLGDLLFVLAIGVVMFFRFTRVSREQAYTAAELEAAREIQQRLVPAVLPDVPGCSIEAVYLPAQEVGGDFYQVIRQHHGATMIVIGDVSGKGLKAAMTGALAIGALRTLAGEDLPSAELLTRLNRQMLQTQESGFITCLCIRLDASGATWIANAGHLSPYRNGEEIPLESGLPLGVAAEAEYSEARFDFAPGDTLTLLSDGVVEATDTNGQLFGFERTREVSAQSAASIAAAAQRFGQQDDITVLSLMRTA
jgi:hypothetical protein